MEKIGKNHTSGRTGVLLNGLDMLVYYYQRLDPGGLWRCVVRIRLLLHQLKVFFFFFFPHASVVTAKGRGIWFSVNSGSSVFTSWIISVETRRSVWWRCLDIISSIAVWCLAQEIRNHGWIETEIRGDDNGRRKAQSGQTKLKCYSFHPACDHTVLGHAGLTSDPLAVAADERLINPLAPLTPPTL